MAGRGGVPAGAAAVVVNVTVVDPVEAGFVTVSPCGSPVPVASSLNFGPGDVVPNELVAKVGVNGSICVFTDAETHLLADVVGYLPAGPGYAPLSPARLLDTRSANSTVDGLFAVVVGVVRVRCWSWWWLVVVVCRRVLLRWW